MTSDWLLGWLAEKQKQEDKTRVITALNGLIRFDSLIDQSFLLTVGDQ